MSEWIESHAALRDHPKLKRLARTLDIHRREATGLLHWLWWWAMDYAPDGDLADFSDEDVADGVDWEGDPAVLMAALTDAGFIDNRVLHDWEDYGGKLQYRRRANAERMRTARAKQDDDVCNARVQHVRDTCGARGQTDIHTGQTDPRAGAREKRVTKGNGNPAEFDAFWKLYPKKQDRGHAEKAWTAALKKTDAATIIAGLERLLPDLAKRERQYIPLAATWLNGARWTDEPEISGKPAHTPWQPPAPEPTREEREEAAKKFGALARGKGIDTFNAMMGRGMG